MFRIRKDADQWFRKIEGKSPIKTKFDLFYLCLMLGFKNELLDSVVDGVDVYHKFPQEFEGGRMLILTLLITTEMHREGIVFEERNSVQELIARYVATDSPSNLSVEGFKKVNGYASGGFDKLSGIFEDPPEDINVFIARYCRLFSA